MIFCPTSPNAIQSMVDGPAFKYLLMELTSKRSSQSLLLLDEVIAF